VAATSLLLAALVHGVARESLQLAATGLALFSLDDLAVDLIFFFRAGWRRCTVYRIHDRAAAGTLRCDSAAAMAILVPAWDESAVIGAMLRDLTGRLDYPHYRVFVGTYPNDAATRETVVAVADERITIVDCDRPGPTTKADCLNHLWRAVLAEEMRSGERFKAVVLHDAEDVVDARELQVFDHLIGRLAMVQLPVVPLVDRSSRWVSGHYLDEFAEAHGKDMVVREALGAAVPSAGVACAIDRDMLGRIADLAGGNPFDPDCLTEDYEIGMRIKALGGRGGLVRIAGEAGGGVVATREHFPATIDTALRQKTRWLLGIAFGGWDRLGWSGGWADRFMLMRDRKVIVAALLTLFGYIAMALVLLDAAAAKFVPGAARFTPLVAPGSVLAATLVFTSSVLLWRLVVRAGFTASVHGWREGLRAVPRVVVGNLINALAAWRATGRYLAIRRGRAELVWDKTAHRFPGVV
jgi:adsorption protein B